MLALYRSRSKKVSTEVILSAVVLFIGIVILHAGYYRGSELLLDIGLLVVLSGVLSEVFFILMAGKIYAGRKI
jgi:hypothetical protein